MTSLSPDVMLDEAKQDTRKIFARIYSASKARNLKIGRKLLELISSTGSMKVIDTIRRELSDILMGVDMETISDPDPYIESMLHGVKTRP